MFTFLCDVHKDRSEIELIVDNEHLVNSNYVNRLSNFYTSDQGLITIAVSSYNRCSCLQPLFLFTILCS